MINTMGIKRKLLGASALTDQQMDQDQRQRTGLFRFRFPCIDAHARFAGIIDSSCGYGAPKLIREQLVQDAKRLYGTAHQVEMITLDAHHGALTFKFVDVLMRSNPAGRKSTTIVIDWDESFDALFFNSDETLQNAIAHLVCNGRHCHLNILVTVADACKTLPPIMLNVLTFVVLDPCFLLDAPNLVKQRFAKQFLGAEDTSNLDDVLKYICEDEELDICVLDKISLDGRPTWWAGDANGATSIAPVWHQIGECDKQSQETKKDSRASAVSDDLWAVTKPVDFKEQIERTIGVQSTYTALADLVETKMSKAEPSPCRLQPEQDRSTISAIAVQSIMPRHPAAQGDTKSQEILVALAVKELHRQTDKLAAKFATDMLPGMAPLVKPGTSQRSQVEDATLTAEPVQKWQVPQDMHAEVFWKRLVQDKARVQAVALEKVTAHLGQKLIVAITEGINLDHPAVHVNMLYLLGLRLDAEIREHFHVDCKDKDPEDLLFYLALSAALQRIVRAGYTSSHIAIVAADRVNSVTLALPKLEEEEEGED
jgi:hypothetical protein